MGWLNRSKKTPDEPSRQQLLHYVQAELMGNSFAVVRTTWYSGGAVCAVTECTIEKTDDLALMEFTGIVCDALRAGSDVSIICVDSSEAVGLKKT